MSGKNSPVLKSYIWFICHRDGNVPVSFIQKYLMRKLDLTNEAEVSEPTLVYI